MKFYTRSEARSAATRAQAKSKHIMLDSVLNEAIKNQEMQNRFDIFLSHAIKDADLILGVKTLLEESGFTVYVDWIIDPSLERDKVIEFFQSKMSQFEDFELIETEDLELEKFILKLKRPEDL